MIGEADEAGIHFRKRGHTVALTSAGSVSQTGTSGSCADSSVPGGNDAHLELALVDDLAVLVPAHVELALVLVRPLLGHVVRRVAGARGVIQEEGFVRRVDLRILDELDGLVGQVDAQVVAFLRLLGLLDLVVVVDQLRIPLVGSPPIKP